MAQKFGLTWWGQRWIAALEALGAVYANRLPRGRTYARRGAVEDLAIQAGTVTARVQGSRARPYKVALRLPVFDDEVWHSVLVALAGELRHAAALLDGQMPTDVDEVLAGCGVSLFPRPGELDTTCSCPDWANPCKHVAAVHYTLAQTFDADPFLLPALRGRDRERLLAGLRAVRAGSADEDEVELESRGPVPLASLSAAALWDSPGDLAAVAVHPAPPADGDALLRRLGAPPGCGPADVAALHGLAVDAARVAWRLAVDEDTDTADPLLAALRARGMATSRELAEELGMTVAAVRSALGAYVREGVVQRTGHARSTRYLA
jgi:uncharacterized Zn finger protein